MQGPVLASIIVAILVVITATVLGVYYGKRKRIASLTSPPITFAPVQGGTAIPTKTTNMPPPDPFVASTMANPATAAPPVPPAQVVPTPLAGDPKTSVSSTGHDPAPIGMVSAATASHPTAPTVTPQVSELAKRAALVVAGPLGKKFEWENNVSELDAALSRMDSLKGLTPGQRQKLLPVYLGADGAIVAQANLAVMANKCVHDAQYMVNYDPPKQIMAAGFVSSVSDMAAVDDRLKSLAALRFVDPLSADAAAAIALVWGANKDDVDDMKSAFQIVKKFIPSNSLLATVPLGNLKQSDVALSALLAPTSMALLSAPVNAPIVAPPTSLSVILSSPTKSTQVISVGAGQAFRGVPVAGFQAINVPSNVSVTVMSPGRQTVITGPSSGVLPADAVSADIVYVNVQPGTTPVIVAGAPASLVPTAVAPPTVATVAQVTVAPATVTTSTPTSVAVTTAPVAATVPVSVPVAQAASAAPILRKYTPTDYRIPSWTAAQLGNPINNTVAACSTTCDNMQGCVGFSRPKGAADTDAGQACWFKSSLDAQYRINNDPTWQTWIKP